MKLARLFVGSLSAVLLSAAVMAQAPAKRDRRTRRRGAGGRGSRFPQHVRQSVSIPGGARGRSRGRRGRPPVSAAAAVAPARRRSARPHDVVRAALQGVRQPLLARHAPAFLVGAADQRGHHHHRHELRLGHRAGNHRGPDHARSQSARHQVRDHQPRARRPRSGRRGIAEALRRQGRHGRARLGRRRCSGRRPRRAACRRATSPSGPRA